MNASEAVQQLEAELLRQIAALEYKITKMRQEQTLLTETLARIRRENVVIRDITRKNSLNRIKAEFLIIEFLKVRPELPKNYKSIKAHVGEYFPNLRDDTLRSYIHRLKQRGVIVSGGVRGSWKLA